MEKYLKELKQGFKMCLTVKFWKDFFQEVEIQIIKYFDDRIFIIERNNLKNVMRYLYVGILHFNVLRKTKIF